MSVSRSALFGLCLIMFSAGVITTVVIDRYWPTRKADMGGPASASATQAEPVVPNIEPVAAPPANVAEAVPAPTQPSGEPTPVDHGSAPEAKPAPAAPAAKAAPVPARKTVAPAPQAPNRSAARGLPPAQGRGAVRKRPGTATGGSPKDSDRTMGPTGSWTDPFE